jgi:acetylornithine deacetylase/succinyl-diaminopimelate desuccinylase-like protein
MQTGGVRSAWAKTDALGAEIAKRREESLARLQSWIRTPTIAAENRGVQEGAKLMAELLREAGFETVKQMPTDGVPGVFATLDAKAKRTIGLYFMYDVKQVNPSEWASPPFEARLVEVPELGKAVMGRGAVNQKGPQAAFLAALHAIRGVGQKLPVNLVLVAEGEEEIGSPHFHQVVRAEEVKAALMKTEGVFMPFAAQAKDGSVTINLGAKGVLECELISSAEKWGKGATSDVHSSNRARLDSPAFHLVQALATLIDEKGDPAIDGWTEKVKPLSAGDAAMIADAAKRTDEAVAKKSMGVSVWARGADWKTALTDMVARPTVNIEGLVGGYTGPGGMTVLPNRATAKLDFRLVPDMTFEDAVAKLKAHLVKRGFGDIEVRVSGGYDPTSTSANSRLIAAQVSTYQKTGIVPVMNPRLAGSWPGYLFTGAPLSLAAGHFGLGHGHRAHAPDEYYLIDSTNPKVKGFDAAVRSFADYLFALA